MLKLKPAESCLKAYKTSGTKFGKEYRILISACLVADSHSSSYIIRGIKPRRNIWAVHVARTGERTEEYGVLVGKLMERNNVENPGVDGTKRLKYTLKKSVERE